MHVTFTVIRDGRQVPRVIRQKDILYSEPDFGSRGTLIAYVVERRTTTCSVVESPEDVVKKLGHRPRGWLQFHEKKTGGATLIRISSINWMDETGTTTRLSYRDGKTRVTVETVESLPALREQL